MRVSVSLTLSLQQLSLLTAQQPHKTAAWSQWDHVGGRESMPMPSPEQRMLQASLHYKPLAEQAGACTELLNSVPHLSQPAAAPQCAK